MISNIKQKVNQEKYGDNWDRIFRQDVKSAVPKKPDFVKEIALALDSINTADPESAHAEADELLQTFIKVMGYEEVVHAYQRVIKRCDWWACA